MNKVEMDGRAFLFVEIKVTPREMAAWEPERIRRFFAGISSALEQLDPALTAGVVPSSGESGQPAEAEPFDLAEELKARLPTCFRSGKCKQPRNHEGHCDDWIAEATKKG